MAKKSEKLTPVKSKTVISKTTKGKAYKKKAEKIILKVEQPKTKTEKPKAEKITVKEEKTKNSSTKTEKPKAEKIQQEDKPKTNTPKSKATKTEEPKKELSFEESAIEKIYGNEPQKNVVPFPESSLQTQTKNIINEYSIDCSRLPQNILDSINSLVGDFTHFVQNQNMTNMIPVIMDKDLIASNLIKSWIEPNKDLLSQLKSKEAGSISVKAGESKTPSGQVTTTHVAQSGQTSPQGVTPQQPKGISVTKAPVLNDKNMPIDMPSPLLSPPVHTQNNFEPRKPESTYQHSVHNPVVNNTKDPVAVGGISHIGANENKNAYYEMLSKTNPDAHRQQHVQQNPIEFQNNSIDYTPAVIDHERELADYTKSISDMIKTTFQYNHWGYVPLDVIQNMLQNSRKDYSYEVVDGGEHSYINISNSTTTAKTEVFSIKS